MKTIFIQFVILLIFALQSNFVLGQLFIDLEPAKLKVIYNLTWQQDSLNPFRLREEKMVLLLGNQYSSFLSYGSYFIDSIVKVHPNMDIITFRQFNAPRSAHQFRVKKNFLEGQIITTDRVFSDVFVYTEPMSKINWKITGETSQIKGYRVQKATTHYGGRTWEAWFTEAIPFNDGPYKFSGLPGLILKVQDARGHYIFEIESIHTTNEKVYFRQLSSTIQTTKAQFLEIRKRFSQEAANMIRASGVPLHQDQIDNLERAAQNMRRDNNPIELTAD